MGGHQNLALVIKGVYWGEPERAPHLSVERWGPLYVCMYIYLYVLVRSYTNNKRTRGPERSVKRLKPQLHATRVGLTAIMDANTDHSSVCQQRLQRRREQERARRASETSQRRESRLRKRREAYKRRKDAETPEKRSARLATESTAKRQQRASETDSQRVLRLQQLTSSQENRVASESNDQRAARLQHQRQSQSDKISSETEQERAARLQQMSTSQQDRIVNETEQERAARLQQMSASQQDRIANEAEQERAARLQQMSASQEDRIANETEQERAARLQQMSASQQDRIANETEQERAARLQCDAEQHRVATRNLSTVPLLDQPVVQKKLQKFHADLEALNVPQPCATCEESIPEITFLGSVTSRECKRCANDSWYPKLYSSDNNMDPGPIPLELQVHIA